MIPVLTYNSLVIVPKLAVSVHLDVPDKALEEVVDLEVLQLLVVEVLCTDQMVVVD